MRIRIFRPDPRKTRVPFIFMDFVLSMGWFKGKPHIEWKNLWFPVDFPLNQSIDFKYDFHFSLDMRWHEKVPHDFFHDIGQLVRWWFPLTVRRLNILSLIYSTSNLHVFLQWECEKLLWLKLNPKDENRLVNWDDTGCPLIHWFTFMKNNYPLLISHIYI